MIQEKKIKKTHIPLPGMKEEISLLILETLRDIREYYEQFYVHKFNKHG